MDKKYEKCKFCKKDLFTGKTPFCSKYCKRKYTELLDKNRLKLREYILTNLDTLLKKPTDNKVVVDYLHDFFGSMSKHEIGKVLLRLHDLGYFKSYPTRNHNLRLYHLPKHDEIAPGMFREAMEKMLDGMPDGLKNHIMNKKYSKVLHKKRMEILSMWKCGISANKIAKETGMSKTYVMRVVT